jgi:hypothetical protein
VIIGVAGFFGFRAYQDEYMYWNYKAIQVLLPNHKSELELLMYQIDYFKAYRVQLTKYKVNYFDYIDGTKANYTANEYNFWSKVGIKGSTESFISRLIGDLVKTRFSTIYYVRYAGFLFIYDSDFPRMTALVHCVSKTYQMCMDTFFSEIISKKELEPNWWYVHGIRHEGR